MKKALISVLITILLAFTFILTSCNDKHESVNPPPADYTRPIDANIDSSFTVTSRTLVAYFSRTNNTKSVAEKIGELTAADIFEIARKEPYPDEYTPTTEVAREEKENNARPELASYLPDEAIAQYDTVFLGFPIWWHTAPMAVLSFLNYYDLSGKTIYTFATSGGSAISESTEDITSNTNATVVEGRLFSRDDETNIENWLDGLGLTVTPEQPDSPDAPSVLVVYYSATGSTERVAGYIAQATGGTLFELVPVDAYTRDDLDWTDDDSRVVREHNDASLRDIELTQTSVENWTNYDTVFIGYPIWWGTAAWPVNGFIENNDFTGKTVIPFCTSASSPMGQSGALLAEAAGTGDWQSGMRFNSNVSRTDVESWVSGIID